MGWYGGYWLVDRLKLFVNFVPDWLFCLKAAENEDYCRTACLLYINEWAVWLKIINITLCNSKISIIFLTYSHNVSLISFVFITCDVMYIYPSLIYPIIHYMSHSALFFFIFLPGTTVCPNQRLILYDTFIIWFVTYKHQDGHSQPSGVGMCKQRENTLPLLLQPLYHQKPNSDK